MRLGRKTVARVTGQHRFLEKLSTAVTKRITFPLNVSSFSGIQSYSKNWTVGTNLSLPQFSLDVLLKRVTFQSQQQMSTKPSNSSKIPVLVTDDSSKPEQQLSYTSTTVDQKKHREGIVDWMKSEASIVKRYFLKFVPVHYYK